MKSSERSGQPAPSAGTILGPMLHVSAWPEQDQHDTGPNHPERPRRVEAALRGLEQGHVEDMVVRLAPRQAQRAELERVHKPAYLDWLEKFCRSGGGQLDPDTVATPGSWETALLAAGGALAVVESLQQKGEGFGFVAHRPPGHHATADQAMGFCLINNVAVAAGALVSQGQKVLILDWDVHHGNGTESIFWDDDRVLYVSTHQSPLYPGTGSPSEIGGERARGANINIPVPPRATGDVMSYALDVMVAPAVEAFAPDWVLISAGFDAHRADPLADLMLSAGDFADMAVRASRWAPGPGRVIMVLEGGYDLAAIAASTGTIFSALLGGDYRPERSTSGGPGREAVDWAVEVYRRRLATV